MSWIKREFLHILPIFLFFLISFTLINWVEALLFEERGITPFRFGEIALAAALIAKIVLVADHLRCIDHFKRSPLIYTIFWKTSFYWTLLLIVRFAIRLVPYLFGKEGFATDFATFSNHFDWRIFVSIQFYYLMLLFVFVTFQELTVKIGVKAMKQLFFGKS